MGDRDEQTTVRCSPNVVGFYGWLACGMTLIVMGAQAIQQPWMRQPLAIIASAGLLLTAFASGLSVWGVTRHGRCYLRPLTVALVPVMLWCGIISTLFGQGILALP